MFSRLIGYHERKGNETKDESAKSILANFSSQEFPSLKINCFEKILKNMGQIFIIET